MVVAIGGKVYAVIVMPVVVIKRRHVSNRIAVTHLDFRDACGVYRIRALVLEQLAIERFQVHVCDGVCCGERNLECRWTVQHFCCGEAGMVIAVVVDRIHSQNATFVVYEDEVPVGVTGPEDGSDDCGR